jgi:dsDNA-specific endonuclease/ATPase MutS2
MEETHMPQFYVQGYKPMLEPLTGSEIAEKYSSDIKQNLNLLVQQVKNLELQNAELESELNTTKTERDNLSQGVRDLLNQRDKGWANHRVVDQMLQSKARRHIERHQRKRQKANNAGDLMAGAAADQRIRALEALLED